MSRREVTCVEYVCDDCGEADSYDEATIHYEPDAPLPEEWQVIDAKDICGACQDRRTCVAEGHGWSEWWKSYMDPAKEFRSCDVCGAVTWRGLIGVAGAPLPEIDDVVDVEVYCYCDHPDHGVGPCLARIDGDPLDEPCTCWGDSDG